jgi:MerR family transcriptional regulator, light-induced transcriptional regulator
MSGVERMSTPEEKRVVTVRRSGGEWLPIGELAHRSGITPDRLRVWERRYGLLKPRRTVGNRRLYSSADVARVKLMQRFLAEGRRPAQAAEMVCAMPLTIDVGAGKSVTPRDVADAHSDLRAALDRYEESAAQRVLERLFIGYSRVAVIRDVLLPYLREVGERWADGHLSVAQEHFASGFLEARFMAMARGWDRGSGPRALLACPPAERHTFGLVAFGIALHEAGWRITYLGADTPIAMVQAAADQLAPDLVALAAVAAQRFLVEEPALARLASGVRCAVAGAGAHADLCQRIAARHLDTDPISAASLL